MTMDDHARHPQSTFDAEPGLALANLDRDDGNLLAADLAERGLTTHDGLDPPARSQEPNSLKKTPRPRPTAYLDGLRGIAALLVYISHHIVRFYGGDDELRRGYSWDGTGLVTALPLLRMLFTGGGAAVAVFFVLSGYVLSRGPLAKLRGGAGAGDGNNNDSRRRLYRGLVAGTIKRPVRLFVPPAVVSLAMALVMQLPPGLRPWMGWPESRANVFAELGTWFVELWLMMNPFVPHSPMTRWFRYDPPVWTLPVEFQGSIVIFALIACLSLVHPRWRAATLLCLGIFLLLASFWAMACFVAGQLLALSHLDGTGDMKTSWQLSDRVASAILHLVFFLGLLLLGQVSDPSSASATATADHSGLAYLTKLVSGPDSYRIWNSLGAACLIYATLRLRWPQRFLMTRPLQHLGKVSFALYLTHIPFLWTVGERVYRLFGAIGDPKVPMWWDNRLLVPDIGPNGLSTRFLIAQAVILPLNLLLADFVTRTIDEPSVRLGQWIAAKLG